MQVRRPYYFNLDCNKSSGIVACGRRSLHTTRAVKDARAEKQPKSTNEVLPMVGTSLPKPQSHTLPQKSNKNYLHYFLAISSPLMPKQRGTLLVHFHQMRSRSFP